MPATGARVAGQAPAVEPGAGWDGTPGVTDEDGTFGVTGEDGTPGVSDEPASPAAGGAASQTV